MAIGKPYKMQFPATKWKLTNVWAAVFAAFLSKKV